MPPWCRKYAIKGFPSAASRYDTQNIVVPRSARQIAAMM
jgi:hypothetical protein